MVSQGMLLKTLDLLTTSPKAEIETLGSGAPTRVNRARNIIDQDNIVAVGISEKVSENTSTGLLAITFYVDKKKPIKKLSAEEVIPPALLLDVSSQPVPTDVIAIGRPKLEAKAPWVKRKPIQPGNSIGHVKVTAGTLGAIVKKNGQYYLLSNSHVLARSGKAKKGDKILFPGKADGGTPNADVIGELADFVAFQVGGEMINRSDCAIALPLPERLADLVSDIKILGVPKGIIKPKRGMKVTKAGRTTHVTKGEIKDVNFRMTLPYPDGVGTVGFLDQVFCSRYSDGGDSGSLVLEVESKKAVGLHFAGYPDAHGVQGSVFNPIKDVLDPLGVKLVTKTI